MLWGSTTLHTMKNFLLSDWGAPIESAVRAVAAVAVAFYVTGAMAHDWIVKLSDGLAAVVVARPPAPVARPAVLYACAVPPPRNLTTADPLGRAIVAVVGGSSQAAAARAYGVSRSTLSRRLRKMHASLEASS